MDARLRARDIGVDRPDRAACDRAADEGGILVAQRHVDGAPHAAALLGRRHEGGPLLDRGAQRLTQARMQDGGGVLDKKAVGAVEVLPKRGKAENYKKGGKVSSASKRADGIATKGKTKGRII